MTKSISDHQRERRVTLKYQLMLAVPVMARAEDLSKRCNLDICYVYASKDEMAYFLDAYEGDPEELRTRVIADFQKIYRSVIFAGCEYVDLLFEACDAAGFLASDEKSKKKHVEAGMPISKKWIERRREILDQRARRHTAQLANNELKIQEIAAIQSSLDIGLDSLLEAITEMYSRLANHLKTKRDIERLKWSKISVFVGGGGSLAKLGVSAL
jgi:hypothetical protein